MPCYDPRPDDWEEQEINRWKDSVKQYKNTTRKFEALLCGLCKEMGGDLEFYTRKVNWEEVGMHRRDFFTWYRVHLEKDKENKGKQQ